MSNEESTFFYSGLHWCVSSLTKPSVTQFCHFTTRRSHVSLYTGKKESKSSTTLFSAQTKGKTLGAPLICAAHCNKTQGAVLTLTQQTENIIWRQKCPKNEFSAEKRRPSTRAWGTSLTACRGRWAWPQFLPSELKSLAQQPSAIIFLWHSHKGWPQKLLLALQRELAFFCAQHQLSRVKFLFPVTFNANTLCYVGLNIFRPGDLITIYSNWHMALKYKY